MFLFMFSFLFNTSNRLDKKNVITGTAIANANGNEKTSPCKNKASVESCENFESSLYKYIITNKTENHNINSFFAAFFL